MSADDSGSDPASSGCPIDPSRRVVLRGGLAVASSAVAAAGLAGCRDGRVARGHALGSTSISQSQPFHGLHQSGIITPTQAAAIFDGYRDRPGRVIGLMIVTVVLGIVPLSVILALFVALFGGSELFSNLGELMTAAQSAKPGTAQVVPELPSGFGTLLLVLLLVLVGVIFNGVYALSLGQVVLAERSIGEALRDGISGTLKNLLPLLILMVIALVVGSLAAVVVVLLLGMLNLVGGFIHPTVGMILAAPLYLVTMLAVYVISFGVMYFMWRDICADGDSAPVHRDDQLEV